MERALPPLTALRAFEAAARLRSISKAGDELKVTPAAVSHQIQQLEDLLGVQLFRRTHRGIELTEAAHVLLPKLHAGFVSLREAVERVREFRSTDVLTISASPAFASHWLMPRLHRFVIDNPNIDVRVSTRVRQFLGAARQSQGDAESVSMWANEADVVIAYGAGHYPGLQVDPLLALTITPLCSPKLVHATPIRKPVDLRRCRLIHDDRGLLYEDRSFWQLWADEAGLSGLDTHEGLHFSHAILALEAAVEGLGIVASTPELALSEVATGRLVAPFALRVPIGQAYYLVCGPAASRRKIVRTFRQWLLKQAASQAKRPERPPRARARKGRTE